MAVDMFMKVEGCSGESQDANHKSWTDVASVQWGITQPGSMATGGGGGAGKASFKDLTITAYVDKALPSIMSASASGKHLGQVEVSICKAGGTQVEYMHVTLTQVLVTDVNIVGTHNDERVLVTYSFQAAQSKTQYWEQTAQGGKGAESQMGWSIKENKAM